MLRLISTHCGQPWIDEANSTIAHWENIYMACTSVTPLDRAPDFVHFVNTRGRFKIMFRAEYPTLAWQRGRNEIEQLGLREEVQPLFSVEIARQAYK